ncbi:MAG: hypothetical protein OXE85_08490 [Roseovarius sp.]|nr:hypothetical protein [Roseovarius sp.]
MAGTGLFRNFRQMDARAKVERLSIGTSHLNPVSAWAECLGFLWVGDALSWTTG